jgi:polysaccharide pyruvyl transferase WcaK-like protein
VTRPLRRIGLFGYLGSGNLGNDASLEAVLAWLRSTYPDIELRGITSAPEEMLARYGIRSVPLHWSSSSESGGRAGQAARKLLGLLIDVPRSFVLAGSVDAVIVPGMGVLEDGLSSRPWNMPLWLFLMAAACRIRRRPFVLLNIGANRARNPLVRRLYVATAGLTTHLSYRDRESAEEMRQAGSRVHAVVAPDVAFVHPAPTAADPEPGRVVLGVMAYYGHADDPVRGADVRRRYAATMAEVVVQLADSGCRVVLVGGDRVDVDVAREVRTAVRATRPELSDDAVVLRECTRFTELTEEMCRAEVVVASRFHNVICALRLARPTISIGYAGKNHHLMQQMGLEDYSQDIEHLDASRLVAQVAAARRHAAALTDQIRQVTSAYPDRVEAVLDHVADEALGLDPPRDETPSPNEELAWLRT